MKMLVEFIYTAVKSGQAHVNAPIYSHVTYDRIHSQHQTVSQPDILILEGLNVLQTGLDSPVDIRRPFVSDFVDFFDLCRCRRAFIEAMVSSAFAISQRAQERIFVEYIFVVNDHHKTLPEKIIFKLL